MWGDPKFLAFAGYFALMVAIGVYTMKFSSKGVNAFFIGDRKLSKYVVSLKAGLIAELVPGFFGGLVVAVVVSLLTRPPEDTDQLVADFS